MSLEVNSAFSRKGRPGTTCLLRAVFIFLLSWHKAIKIFYWRCVIAHQVWCCLLASAAVMDIPSDLRYGGSNGSDKLPIDPLPLFSHPGAFRNLSKAVSPTLKGKNRTTQAPKCLIKDLNPAFSDTEREIVICGGMTEYSSKRKNRTRWNQIEMHIRESFGLCRDLLRQSNDQTGNDDRVFQKMIATGLSGDPATKVWYALDVVLYDLKITFYGRFAHNVEKMDR